MATAIRFQIQDIFINICELTLNYTNNYFTFEDYLSKTLNASNAILCDATVEFNFAPCKLALRVKSLTPARVVSSFFMSWLVNVPRTAGFLLESTGREYLALQV